MSQDEYFEIGRRYYQAIAEQNHALERRGERIAKTNGWTNISGIEAVKYYLLQKHHWTPAQLDAMSIEQLRFAMRFDTAGELPAP